MASRMPWVWATLVVVLTVGCSQQDEVSHGPTADGARFTLAAEPDGATGVVSLREAAQNDEPVVVVGRIGGGVKPWVAGRAAFMLADASFQPSCQDEACEAGCPHCAEEAADCTVLVKFMDAAGRVLPVDARSCWGCSDQDMVVVQGRTRRDESGNLSVLAEGIYVRR